MSRHLHKLPPQLTWPTPHDEYLHRNTETVVPTEADARKRRRTTEFPVGSAGQPSWVEAATASLAQSASPLPLSGDARHAIPSGPYYLPPPIPSTSRRRSSAPYYALIALVMLIAGAGIYALWPRSGLLQIVVTPPDARVDINGAAISGPSPFLVKKRAGVYQLAVSSPGYTSVHHTIQIASSQRGRLRIALKPSPETVLRLTSTPSGIPVWLDGRRLVATKDGRQARTDLQAVSIAPGRHVIELAGDPRYRPWRMEVYQDPDRTLRLHADLVPTAQTGTSTKSSARAPVGASHSDSVARKKLSRARASGRRSAKATPSSSRPAPDPFEDSTWRTWRE